MRCLIGPILHLRQSTPEDWRFAVGLLVQDTKPKSLSLVLEPAAAAAVSGPPTALGELGGTFALAGMRAIGGEGPSPLLAVSHVETEVVRVSPANGTGSRSSRGTGPKGELWVRWLTEDGDVKPPLVVHPRVSAPATP